MRRVATVLGAFGLVVGLAFAVIVHDLPAGITGRRISWTGYMPTDVDIESPVSISFTWLPSLLVLPGLGLALGVVVGVVLARLGWRFTRPVS